MPRVNLQHYTDPYALSDRRADEAYLKLIKQHMGGLGITKGMLAKTLGMSRQTLTARFRNIGTLTRKEYRNINRALDISEADIKAAVA